MKIMRPRVRGVRRALALALVSGLTFGAVPIAAVADATDPSPEAAAVATPQPTAVPTPTSTQSASPESSASPAEPLPTPSETLGGVDSTPTPTPTAVVAPGEGKNTAEKRDAKLEQSRRSAQADGIGNAIVAPFALGPDGGAPPYVSWDTRTAAGVLVGGATYELQGPRNSNSNWNASVQVADCVAANAAACSGPDLDPDAGEYLVKSIGTHQIASTNRYRVRQSTPPSGYSFATQSSWREIPGRSSTSNSPTGWTVGGTYDFGDFTVVANPILTCGNNYFYSVAGNGEVRQVQSGICGGSHLPVGGVDTHAVITAHRGLANAAMFTELDGVGVGDRFTIETLGEVLTYEVVETKVVEPDETDSLRAVAGQDLVTLVTCTPLGINSHRILVTGERVTPTPVADIEDAGAVPDIPGFPWWALWLGGGVVLAIAFVWRSGYTDARRRDPRIPDPRP